MTTYNASAVTDSVIGFQKPITLQQGRALRDNPIAITEGATGAPKNADLSLKERTTYNTATSADYITLTDLAAFRTIIVVGYVNIGTAETNRTIAVEMSTNNGSSWSGGPANIIEVNTTGLAFDSLRPYSFSADLVRGIVVPEAGIAAADFGAASYNALRWRSTAGVTLLVGLSRADDCKAV